MRALSSYAISGSLFIMISEASLSNLANLRGSTILQVLTIPDASVSLYCQLLCYTLVSGDRASIAELKQ